MNTNSKQVWTQVWVKNIEEVDDSIHVYVNMEPSSSAKLIKRMLLDIILIQDKLRKKFNWKAADNEKEERKKVRLSFLAKQDEKIARLNLLEKRWALGIEYTLDNLPYLLREECGGKYGEWRKTGKWDLIEPSPVAKIFKSLCKYGATPKPKPFKTQKGCYY